MTRNQALRSIAATFETPGPLSPDARHAELVVKALEALGLIAFAPEPQGPAERDEAVTALKICVTAVERAGEKSPYPYVNPISVGRITTNGAHRLVDALSALGFKIVKA